MSDINNLKELNKALQEANAYMIKAVRNENVAICLGDTTSGKSTLIHYLRGNSLRAVKLNRTDSVRLISEDDSSGPEIGKGLVSQTTIPSKWITKNLPNLIIWDTPGFDDNRGAQQDIQNSFYIYNLMQNANSLKIILVIDINYILTDNIKQFLTALKSLETLLGYGMSNFFASISVVFTKVPNIIDDSEVDIEFVKEKLVNLNSSCDEVECSSFALSLLQYLIKNDSRMALFKKVKVGRVTSDIGVNIIEAIKNSRSIRKESFKRLNVSISDSSKDYLHNLRGKVLLTPTSEDLESVVTNLIARKLKLLEELKGVNDEIIKGELIKGLDEKMNHIQNVLFKISDENDLNKKIEILQTVDDETEKEIVERDLIIKIKLMDFIEKILELEESKLLITNFQLCLKEMREIYGGIKKELDETKKLEKHLFESQIDKLHFLLEQKIERMRGFFTRMGMSIDKMFYKYQK